MSKVPYLISHPSKVMPIILLTRLKPQAEEIIKQEGFRVRRSTTEHIFNLRILCEKYMYLQHQQNVFVDSKKAFDRVWNAALWATIECLYDKEISAVYHNNIGEWFGITIRVRQG